MDDTSSPAEIDPAVCKEFWQQRALLAQDPRSVRLGTGPLWTVRLGLKLYQRWLLRRLPTPRTRFVVDLACGNGDWTEVLARRADRVLAVDFSEGMAEACRARLASEGLLDRADVICADVADVAIPSCDLVTAGAVTQYLGDERVDTLLGNVHAALLPDGLFYLRTTVSKTGATFTKSDTTYQAIYRPKSWYDERIARAGFVTVDTATRFAIDEASRMLFGRLRALFYYPVLGALKVLRLRSQTDVAVYLLRSDSSMLRSDSSTDGRRSRRASKDLDVLEPVR